MTTDPAMPADAEANARGIEVVRREIRRALRSQPDRVPKEHLEESERLADLAASLVQVERLVTAIASEDTPSLSPESDQEEIEAREIIDRVERELTSVEERTERLMHQYGL